MKPSKQALTPAIAKLVKNGWVGKGKKLRKDFKFADFRDAFAFMARCALEIDSMDHHPEWLNVYNKITVELTTHDAGGITANDIALAHVMDKAYKRFR